jgi:hypothetical protein
MRLPISKNGANRFQLSEQIKPEWLGWTILGLILEFPAILLGCFLIRARRWMSEKKFDAS